MRKKGKKDDDSGIVASLPPPVVSTDLLAMLEPGKLRSVEDVIDLQAGILSEILRGNVPAPYSRELRGWGEQLHAAVLSRPEVASARQPARRDTVRALLLEAQLGEDGAGTASRSTPRGRSIVDIPPLVAIESTGE